MKRPTDDRELLPEEVRELPRLPLVVILEDLRSAFNVGSIFRTADATRTGRLYLAGYTPRPPHPKIAKTALGSEESVPWEGTTDAPSIASALRQEGYSIVALEQTRRSRSLWDAPLSRPLCLVLGNEVTGVREETLDECDADLEIPMAGWKNSINVATAYGVVAYEVWRRWGGESALIGSD